LIIHRLLAKPSEPFGNYWANIIKSGKNSIPDALVIADEQGLELGTVRFEAVLLTALGK
jgi:hypothetical protein